MYFLGKIDTLFLSYQIIMNNSQESIALPDFAVRLVHRSDEGFINEEIELKKYISSCGLGLILYFYPKDNTQGCSVQASDFTALADEFVMAYVLIKISSPKKNFSLGLSVMLMKNCASILRSSKKK